MIINKKSVYNYKESAVIVLTVSFVGVIILSGGENMAIIEHSGYYEGDLQNVSHTHTSCEIMYVLKGELEITIEDAVYHIKENTLVLIKSRQHHKVRMISTDGYHRYIAMINPWELRKQLVRPDLFALLTDISRSGIVIVHNAYQLYELFSEMTYCFENGTNLYNELGIALKLVSLFYGHTKSEKTDKLENSKQILVKKVREYIEKFYADNIRISTIAENNYISVGYLTHIFKEETGMSPREYLSHIRCTRAYELIKHTAMKFSAISAVCGFSCANDMSRKIREYYGTSPTDIRAEI